MNIDLLKRVLPLEVNALLHRLAKAAGSGVNLELLDKINELPLDELQELRDHLMESLKALGGGK